MPVTTTFKKLREAGACKGRYAHLRKSLGKEYKDNTPIDICTIMETNGIEDALWIPEHILSGKQIDKRYRLFAVACCQDILHLMKDQRSINAVVAAHLYAHGEIDDAAWAAARDAARAAAWAAAWDAAWERQKEYFWIIFSAQYV